MRVAADFRETAREALRGKWITAVFAGIIATLLGATEDMGLYKETARAAFYREVSGTVYHASEY